MYIRGYSDYYTKSCLAYLYEGQVNLGRAAASIVRLLSGHQVLLLGGERFGHKIDKNLFVRILVMRWNSVVSNH